jgi:hypothetical protein
MFGGIRAGRGNNSATLHATKKGGTMRTGTRRKVRVSNPTVRLYLWLMANSKGGHIDFVGTPADMAARCGLTPEQLAAGFEELCSNHLLVVTFDAPQFAMLQ